MRKNKINAMSVKIKEINVNQQRISTLKGALLVRNSIPGISRSHTGKPLQT